MPGQIPPQFLKHVQQNQQGPPAKKGSVSKDAFKRRLQLMNAKKAGGKAEENTEPVDNPQEDKAELKGGKAVKSSSPQKGQLPPWLQKH